MPKYEPVIIYENGLNSLNNAIPNYKEYLTAGVVKIRN